MFLITSVKMEELLGMGGPFLYRETNRSRSASEKQLLQIALYWLGTGGQYHAVGGMHSVSKGQCMYFFFHLWHKMVRVYQAAIWMYCACCWSTAVSLNLKQSSLSKPLQKGCLFQGYLGWGGPYCCTSPPYLHLFLSFLHCLYLPEMQY